IKRVTEERYLLTMLEVDKSHIPFPDEPPVEFPPASTWKKLTERRKGLYDSVGLGIGQVNRKKALEMKENVDKLLDLERGIDAGTKLSDALDFLADRYDLTFVVDSKAFEAFGLAKVEDQAVQMPKMLRVTLHTVLRIMLGQLKADKYVGTYMIRRDHIE